MEWSRELAKSRERWMDGDTASRMSFVMRTGNATQSAGKVSASKNSSNAASHSPKKVFRNKDKRINKDGEGMNGSTRQQQPSFPPVQC